MRRKMSAARSSPSSARCAAPTRTRSRTAMLRRVSRRHSRRHRSGKTACRNRTGKAHSRRDVTSSSKVGRSNRDSRSVRASLRGRAKSPARLGRPLLHRARESLHVPVNHRVRVNRHGRANHHARAKISDPARRCSRTCVSRRRGRLRRFRRVRVRSARLSPAGPGPCAASGRPGTSATSRGEASRAQD